MRVLFKKCKTVTRMRYFRRVIKDFYEKCLSKIHSVKLIFLLSICASKVFFIILLNVLSITLEGNFTVQMVTDIRVICRFQSKYI